MSRSAPLLSLCAALALAVAVLTGCGISTTDTGSVASTTTPTLTPTYVPPTPTNVPAGWQVYSGPHYTIAYPDGWTSDTSTQANSTAQRPDVVYGFNPPSGGGGVTVNEQDGWDDATIQNDFCRNPSNDPTVTLASLPMRYSTIASGSARSWLFITDKGTVYGLGAYDGYQSGAVKAQDDAVLATFRAQYTTWGCA